MYVYTVWGGLVIDRRTHMDGSGLTCPKPHQSTQQQICPYYLMRQQTPQADLVLMPYNYLLDAGSRKPYQVGTWAFLCAWTVFKGVMCMCRLGVVDLSSTYRTHSLTPPTTAE